MSDTGDQATEGDCDGAYIDLGDAAVLLPDEIASLRHQLMESLTEDEWALARTRFSDSKLAME